MKRTEKIKEWIKGVIGKRDQTTPDQITIVAGDRSIHFDTSSPIAKSWFYPRYREGSLHEPAIAKWFLNRWTSSSHFVDVGANLGFYSILASAYCTAGTVIAIEMDPRLIGEIQKNVALGNLKNVQIVSAAASESTGGLVRFQAHQAGNLSTNTIINDPVETGQPSSPISVVSVAIDDLLSQLNITPDFMKVDVEGHEASVLKGMQNTLPQLRGLAIEIHTPVIEDAKQYRFVQQTLLDAGFVCQAVRGHRGDTEFQMLRQDSDWETLTENTMILCEKEC